MWIPSFATRFAQATSGMAAVEFALTLPFLVTLMFTGIDITDAVSARRKAVTASSTISDLISQAKEVYDADVQNAFTAGTAIMAPFNASAFTAVVTNITMDATGAPKVAWSKGYNVPGRPVGSSVTIPTKLQAPNSSLVMAEVTYSYKPLVGSSFVGSIVMPKQTYAMPRVASKSTGVPCKWTGCT
jgi:Flp pilus assembly protein TadG